MRLGEFILKTIKNCLNEERETVEVYHGSNSKFNTFDDNKLSTGDGSDLFGKGYYFTDNIKVADFYAKLITKKERIKDYSFSGPLKSEVPIYHNDAEQYAENNKKINSFIIDGNILNSQDYILDDNFIKVILESFRRNSGYGDSSDGLFYSTLNFLRENKSRIKNYRGELIYIIGQIVLSNNTIISDIVSHIKNSGYDGVKYRPDLNFEGNADSWNYVIYNKNIIKPKLDDTNKVNEGLNPTLLTKDQMLKLGASGLLDKAFERYIPLEKIVGLDNEPVDWVDDEGKVNRYNKTNEIKKSIEVIYDSNDDLYHLQNGNHRIKQAKINGDKYIRAYIQPDRGKIGEVKFSLT